MEGLSRIVARIASRQHGVVARWQLVAAGISEGWIDVRLGKGWLIRVYPGVYRVGHVAPSLEAEYMAAVLACGDGAVLVDAPLRPCWGSFGQGERRIRRSRRRKNGASAASRRIGSASRIHVTA